MVDRQFVAAKAFIEHGGEVLLVRESEEYEDGTNAGEFDVVGGRVEPGEHPVEGLAREAREETGLDITIGEPFAVDEWRPVVDGEEWQVVGVFFRATADSRDVELGGDHDDHRWVEPAAADDLPLVGGLADRFERFSAGSRR